MSTSQKQHGSSDYSQFKNQLQQQQFGGTPYQILIDTNIYDEQITPFQASISLLNRINLTSQNDLYHDITSNVHTPSTNLFSQKFKDSLVSSVDQLHQTPDNFSLHHTRVFCLQHPNKKVKYILNQETNNQVQACSKCAVQYAMEKNQLQQIQSQLDDKKKQTDSFLDQLKETRITIEQFIDKLKTKEMNLKDFYECQFQKVVTYYFQIEQKMQQVTIFHLLYKTKQAILQELTEYQWKSLEQMNFNRIECKQINHTLVSFLKDIQHNYKNIVKKVETLPFNQIMGGYSSKLHKLQKFFTKIQSDQFEQIEFNGVNDVVLQELDSQLNKLVKQSLSPIKDTTNKKKSVTRSSSEQQKHQRNYFYKLQQQENEKRHSSQPLLQSNSTQKSNLNHIQNMHQNYLKLSHLKNTNKGSNVGNKSYYKITEESVDEQADYSKSDNLINQLNNRTRVLARDHPPHLLYSKTLHQIDKENNVLESNMQLHTEPSELKPDLSPNMRLSNTNRHRPEANSKIINTFLMGLNSLQNRQSVQKDTKQQINAKMLYQNIQDSSQYGFRKGSKTPEVTKQKLFNQNQNVKISPKFLFKNYYK